ncbi:uncharacterized protein LOC111061182 isoform X1 [Nilaparvata lugens]|uniref:uncharacterized protein LOC111061182 isoform X1 n=1 Tax=Nilaparvata lugens TaxID=108931 RepID=UPI000B9959CB|nr:uncharacterized protein LOC111061182 isoform X1 [Nilaparvata lugens]
MRYLLLEIPALVIFISLRSVASINCYTCSSHNGSNPHCEDPFNPAMSTYKEKCMVPKAGHIGLFPANFCIKIDGRNVKTKEVTVIRACVMKSMDSQCGGFKYEDIMMKGCIQSCDYDGCNSALHFFQLNRKVLVSIMFFHLSRCLIQFL